MRAEHQMSYDEHSAFTGWRRFYNWRPGERKRIKRNSHHIDRRKAQREIRRELG